MSQDIITLNVGGIKYETFRSTLTNYPKTLLGKMFCKNTSQPTNEYFIDRDGQVFRYILQYYRNNGKIYWPNSNQSVSNEELVDELNYFQIPIPIHTHDSFSEETPQRISKFHLGRISKSPRGGEELELSNERISRPLHPVPLTANLPTFISAFDKVMKGMETSNISAVQIRFGDGYIVIEPENRSYEELFRPFENNGLELVHKNGHVMQENFSLKYFKISWNQSESNDEIVVLLMKR
ncbi:BTB/POZ protein [Glomus cerebriforme]|uniref:BTB/POZ protein n=1 Tax=Glomus cerebriforme TaxID=658196 RepID=A0A397S834_9GLOM|nr:BTB/POZ protein [Glomus cerebriforme]